MAVYDQILIEESRFRKSKDSLDEDPYMEIVRVAEIVEYNRIDDNVVIMISKGHYISFRLDDLLKIIGKESK